MGWLGRGTAVDNDAVQMLQTLPPDLVERGWQLVVAESEVLQSADGPRYRAVHVRPVDSRLNHQSIHSTTFDHRTRPQVMRVSPLKDCSPSWRGACRDAIRRMRETDAKRRRKQ